MNRAETPPDHPPPPIITLLSDFGTQDFYVPAMKAAIIKQCPAARLIDITHQIPRHDILCGSIALERAIDAFPSGTIHLAVIDPGVGTNRRILVVQIYAQWVVCPDNGLITWAWRRLGGGGGGGAARELSWRPKRSSRTFHGRDIMAPAAAMLASGVDLVSIARPITSGDAEPIHLLDLSPATEADGMARIIHVDCFGNATTNLGVDVLRRKRVRSVRAAGRDLGKLRKTYGDVPPGKPLALIGSSGLLEIAVRDGSAAADLGLRVGDNVELSCGKPT